MVLMKPRFLRLKIGVGSERPMRMALAGAPNVDPATGSNWAATYIYCNIYDSLVMYDINGKIVPLLAEDWEIADDGHHIPSN
ncbi:MAG: hypothetical protein ACOX42_02605 [Clostridia bacterium]